MFSVRSMYMHIKGLYGSRVIGTFEIALRLYYSQKHFSDIHIVFVWKSTRLGDSPLETLLLFSREIATLIPLIWRTYQLLSKWRSTQMVMIIIIIRSSVSDGPSFFGRARARIPTRPLAGLYQLTRTNVHVYAKLTTLRVDCGQYEWME